jgi:integrase/recombinase XerD
MSPLAQAVQDYLSLRRALGFQLRDVGRALVGFVAFLDQQGASAITIPLALGWAQATSSSRPAEWARRLSYVRGFARYWSATDPRTEIPPWGLLPHQPHRARPYLYTDEEIGRLLDAARHLPPASGLRGWTYGCLLGLLAVTGLRISEALRLQPADVDWAEEALTIHGTKFGKSRLVPLHASSLTVLAEYARRRDRFLAGRPTPRFFISARGRPLEVSAVRRTFYELSRQTGLRGPQASHGPRLHDFRHRFAVQTLMQWYRSGQDVERRLPVLSTYLGHGHVRDTYWYLTACPELMGLATTRLERRWEERS